jgi:hypothetical protein
MITKGNFVELIRGLDSDTLNSFATGEFFEKDFVLMEAHIFNVGGYATVESVDYDESLEEEADAHGNLFCDADSFLQLLEETNALEF